jgi:Uma2 family endonuclease
MVLTKTLTHLEYLAFERDSETRHEFINQTLIPMAGASRLHNFITLNLAALIWQLMRHSENETYQSDMRLLNPLSGSYFYPDVMVSDGKGELVEDGHFDTLTNPILIVEVLSPSTAIYDKTDKFIACRGIKTLKEYILVSSDKVMVEIYRRNADDNWYSVVETNLTNNVKFESINLDLPLKEIYARVF